MRIETNKIGVSKHNVSLNISSNNPKLIEYASEHLGGLARDPMIAPDIEVNCQWNEGNWRSGTNPFSQDGELSVYGKHMLGKQNELIWLNTLRMKGLQLRFRRSSGRFLFDITYCNPPKKENIGSTQEYEARKYFSLMNYLFYYPLFWYLENFRNWTPIHASAIETTYGGVMIGGLGRNGKTTLCATILQNADARLISENIVLTDGEHLYPCFKPIHLNGKNLKMLSEKFQGLRKMRLSKGLKERSLNHFDLTNMPIGIRSAALFLPNFSPQCYIKRIVPEIAVEKLLAVNRLTPEIDNYYRYASALEMIWPKVGQMHLRPKILCMLTQKTLCFDLGINRTQGADVVIKDIMSSVKEKHLNAKER